MSTEDTMPATVLEEISLYRLFKAEREEILRHKWLESEKAGRDLGWDWALVNWTIHHRSAWKTALRQKTVPLPTQNQHARAA